MAEITADIRLNRAKKAAEAYKELKAIYTDSYGELDPACPPWATFRDEFIAEWAKNRTIVTEEEADAMFDKIAEETEGGLPAGVDLVSIVESALDVSEDESEGAPEVAATPAPVVEAAPIVKRRGRPPGSGKAVKAAVAKVKKTKIVGKAVAAKKKSGGSASAKAATIIAMGQSRKWERKRILEKLQNQLGMGAAYAATLYQKHAN